MSDLLALAYFPNPVPNSKSNSVLSQSLKRRKRYKKRTSLPKRIHKVLKNLKHFVAFRFLAINENANTTNQIAVFVSNFVTLLHVQSSDNSNANLVVNPPESKDDQRTITPDYLIRVNYTCSRLYILLNTKSTDIYTNNSTCRTY